MGLPKVSVALAACCAALAACSTADLNGRTDSAAAADDAPGDVTADVLTDTLADAIAPATDAPAETAGSPDLASPEDVVLPDAPVDGAGVPDAPVPDGAASDGVQQTDTFDISSDEIASVCTCGDGVCGTDCGESTGNCSADCKSCGNGTCDSGENPKTCKVDCCGACGDGKCKGYDCGESPEVCPADCGAACGNKSCDKGETPATCAEDCAFQVCGNGVCEAKDGGPAKCPEDCAASCGDGTCNKGEDFLACPVDCGYCGDGFCVSGLGEDGVSCVADCKAPDCNPDLPEDVTNCDDQNPCTIEQCAPAGVCRHPSSNGGACTDGSACTIGDHCSMSACLHLNLVDCDDQNACSADKCDPASGCYHSALTGACDDGNLCTIGDTCKDSGCLGGAALNCEDGNPCTQNGCDVAAGCTQTDAAGSCTDGDPCTLSDSCAGGLCIGGPGIVCDDGNPCTTDSCTKDQGCTHKGAIGACEDGNSCTTGDLCMNSVCTPGSGIDCSDGNACTIDQCDAAGGCHHDDAKGACTDGNSCTIADSCQSSACVAGAALDCADGNVCTDDSCAAASGCVHMANAATCTDGNACTSGDACLGGGCAPGAGVGCDDSNPCTADFCDAAAGCTHKAAAAACDDQNACTIGDVCKTGVCNGGAARDCGDGNPCTSDACDSVTGCSWTATSGGACSDGNVCTSEDVCDGGACAAGAQQGCDDGNPCTTDGCNTQVGCIHTAAGGACDDGNACSSGDACQNAVCTPGTGLNCSDGNACTLDNCDATGGCVHTSTGGACSDGNACTLGDVCTSGICAPGSALGCDDGSPCTDDSCDALAGCVHMANAATCSDNNVCSTGDACVGGSCAAGAQIPCDDQNPCTTDSCDAAAGCAHKAAAGACDDGDACTVGDLCANGACTGGSARFCDDGKVCTQDGCDSNSGCTVTNLTGACSDGNACTAGDACAGGACMPGATANCDDGNPCTTDGCSATAGCTHAAATGACDDGNDCTSGDACANAVCTSGAAIDCGDNNACTTDSCDANTGCAHSHALGACTDGDACTTSDTCVDGVCQPGTPQNCQDGNPCTDDSCSATTGCVHLANEATCTDLNACSAGDGCMGGSCIPGPQQTCTDNNPCTTDSCNAASGCVFTATTAPCNDGNVCTTTDTCQNGNCVGSGSLNCDDSNVCSDDSCNGISGCVHAAAASVTVCNDGNACTTGDHCGDGSCVATATTNCDDGKACTSDTCNPSSGACLNDPAPQNGAACNDGNVCTLTDTCAGGGCVGSGTANCDDSNQCTVDSCPDAGGCVHTATNAGCDDGNACTTNDLCSASACVGTPKGCDDGQFCTTDSCQSSDGSCVHSASLMNGATCNDGSFCTLSDACTGGVCVGSGTPNCDDGNQCTTDSCPDSGGCKHTVRTGSCDDGNNCTTGDACQGGLCSGTAAVLCNDNNPCTSDACDLATGKCVYDKTALNGTTCSDGNFCTQSDTCSGGSCAGSNPVVCTALDQCHVAGVCVTTSGTCTTPNIVDGTSCDDGNACTTGDICAAGKCAGPAAKDCNDGIACTADSCNSSAGCIHDVTALDGVSCNDNDGCTQTDTCSGGACVGSNPAVCTAQDQCHIAGTCTAGACSHPAKTDGEGCNDGSVCTTGDRCVSGSCTPTGAKSCDDSLPCTNDSCDPTLDCQHTPNTGNACNDNVACTIYDTCEAGTCVGTANCDDLNECTADSCDGALGCLYAATAATACGDYGTCSAGACQCPGGFAAVNQHCPPVLTGLTLEGAPLSPQFAPAVTGYAATMQVDISSANLTATAQSGTAITLQVVGGGFATLQSGVAAPVALRLGPNTLTLTAIHAGISVTYTLSVTRLPTVQQAYVKASNAGTGDLFGTAIAVSGDTLVVGAPSESSCATGIGGDQSNNGCTNAGAVYVYRRSGSTWAQEAYIKGNDTEAWDYFGGSVALDGDMLVVGASGESSTPSSVAVGVPDNNLSSSGAAYVFYRQNGVWSQRIELKAANAGVADAFGESVAISNGTVVVGASFESSGSAGDPSDDSSYYAGAAYVFGEVAGHWTQQAYLKASNAESGDFFGRSLSISGDTIVVGAQGEDSKASGVNGNQSNNTTLGAGAAYVFTRATGHWSQQAYLKAANPDFDDEFGTSVSVSGDTVLVGAPLEDGNGLDPLDNSRTGSGAAYVFVRSAGLWSQQAYLKAAKPDSGDSFGKAVYASGDWAVVGAPAESGGGSGVGADQTDNAQPSAGAAYPFNRAAGVWSQTAYLKSAFADANDSFGAAVAFDGNTAVVGATGEAANGTAVVNAPAGGSTDNSASNAGAAYVFSADTCFFSKAAECDDSNGCTTDACPASQVCTHTAAATGSSCDATGTCSAAQACTCPAGYVIFRGVCAPAFTELAMSKTAVPPSFGTTASHRFEHLDPAVLTVTITPSFTASVVAGYSVNGGANVPLVSGAPGAQPFPLGTTNVMFRLTGAGVTSYFEFVANREIARQEAYVKAAVQNAGQFGSSVAVDGDTMVVGMLGDSSCAMGVFNGATAPSDTACEHAGGAYVFMRQNGAWTQQAYLKASNTGAGDAFGVSVAISGDTIVVGAQREDSNAKGVGGSQADNSATDSGAAYVFVRSGSTWSQQAYVKASNTGASDNFGNAVAISGDTIAVGAMWEKSNARGVNGDQADDSMGYSGATYVFVRSSDTWTQQAYLKASNTDTNNSFGRSVAISGDTLVVGAPGEESGATGVNGNQADDSMGGSGAAYVFVRSGTTWSQQAYIKASNTGAYDNFGDSVGIADETLVVGAYSEDSNATGIDGNQADNSATASGAAYVFVRSNGTWSQQAYLKASNTADNDVFGSSVGISGDILAVGARGEDSSATGVNGNQADNGKVQSGAAYVFIRSGGIWSQQLYLKAANTDTYDSFGSVAVTGHTTVIGAYGERSNATGINGNQVDNSLGNAGAAYVFLVAGP